MPGQRAHIAKLDCLRAVAILLVFAFHALIPIFGMVRLPFKGMWADFHTDSRFVFFLPLSYGWVGVPLFFVLSGFVIHHSTLNSRQAFRTKAFYLRRLWRIYPPYLVALLGLTALSYHATGLTPRGQKDLLLHLFLIHNFSRDYFLGTINSSFWSLAVEAQFYLLYPLLLALRNRVGILRMLVVTALLSLFLCVACAVFTNWKAEMDYAFWWSTPILLVSWALGMYVAERYHEGRRAFALRPAQVVALGVVVVAAPLCKPLNMFAFSLWAFFFAVVMEHYLLSPRPMGQMERALIPLGLCSYSLYLWHQPLLPLLHTTFQAHGLSNRLWADWLIFFPISFALLAGFAYLHYLTVERASIRIGRRCSKTAARSQEKLTIVSRD